MCAESNCNEWLGQQMKFLCSTVWQIFLSLCLFGQYLTCSLEYDMICHLLNVACFFALQGEVEFTPHERLFWDQNGLQYYSSVHLVRLIDNQLHSLMMGGICSRKRDQPVIEGEVRRVVSGRYCKSSSSKWLGTSSFRSTVEQNLGVAGICPSLLDLCISKICRVLPYWAMSA